MSVSFEEREQLRQMLEFEKTMNEFSLKTGWMWGDVQIATREINKLLLKHLVRVALATNSGTGYRVTEEGRLAAEENEQPETDEPIVVDDSKMFCTIVGHEDVKELLKVSLTLDKPVHVLLYGPPAIAKSMFLWEIEKVYGSQCLPFIGSATSHAGMWDMLAERHPRIILIDELEKMNITDMAGLLSLMENGRLIRAKTNRTLDEKMTVWVFATANRIHNIPKELLSRWLRPITGGNSI